MQYLKTIAAVGVLASLLSSVTEAQEHQAAKERVLAVATQYTDAQTVAIGYIDIAEEWIDLWEVLVAESVGSDETTQEKAQAAHARELVKNLREKGARELVILMSLTDAHAEGGPLLVMTQEEVPGATEKVEGLLEAGFPQIGPWRIAINTQRQRTLAGTAAVVERYKKLQSVPRPDLLGPLEKQFERSTMGRPMIGLVLSPGSDARRVVRELWPTLPKPFDQLTGPLLADDFKYATIHFAQPPEWQLAVAVEARHDESATKLKDVAEAGLKLAANFEVNETPTEPRTLPYDVPIGTSPPEPFPSPQFAEVVRRIGSELVVEQEGSNLVVKVTHGSRLAQDLVGKLVAPAITASRSTAQRNSQMNNYKQIALAMHNFESARKHFPASAAIVDKGGKPLLSWRVAILPYIEGHGIQDLYQEFRLDEPWDSEHNLKLARQMPSVFADPGHPELTAEGKTTCLLPVHSETVFQPLAELGGPIEARSGGKKIFCAPGPQFKEITDGTSNTILAIQVAPERAVVWTRPDDWQVDLEKPLDGLTHPKRGVAVAVYCDGHARSISLDLDPATLRAYLTRSGKEIVSH